jgi:hypothetical protein
MRARQTRCSVFHPERSTLAGQALLNVVGYRGSLLATIAADSRATSFSGMCASILRASVRQSRVSPSHVAKWAKGPGLRSLRGSDS